MSDDGSGLYIDTISILNNSGAYFTNVDTTASHSSKSADGDLTHPNGLNSSSDTISYVTTTTEKYGLKFMIQLINKSGSTLTAAEINKYRVEICTRSIYGTTTYDDDEEEWFAAISSSGVGDINIQLPSTSLTNESPIYIGHQITANALGNSSTITPVGEWQDSNGTALTSGYPVYIPDQYGHSTTNPILTTDFTLRWYNGSSWISKQLIGKNSSSSLVSVGSVGEKYFPSGSNSLIPAFSIDHSDGGATTGNSNGSAAPNSGHFSITIDVTTTAYKTFSANNYAWRSSSSSSLTASILGDPHIKTLDGEYYEFDYLGSFRLLEYTINGEKLIINGKAEPGPARWKNNQYIKKLFIQKGENYILIDMGFRGEEVTVLEEKGFAYTEKELDFHKDAKRYSLTSRYKTNSRTEPVTEDLPRLIRNKINFTIDDNNKKPLIFFEISNVNEYNLQPCRLHIKLDNYNVYSKKSKGCLISRLHAPASKLNDIKSCEPIDLLSLKDMDEIPELEINPILRNKQWN